MTSITVGGQRLYAFDQQGSVKVFSLKGKFLTAIRFPKSVPPIDISVDASGSLYSVNEDGTVAPWDQHGVSQRWGREGSGPGEFFSASAVTVDPGGTVYLADNGNRRVQIFQSDGTLRAIWGSERGIKDAQDVAIDRIGNVYVTDFEHSRIVKLSSSGQPLAVWKGVAKP